MIGYREPRAALEARIEAETPGWLARAEARTAEFRTKGRYEEASSIWSEAKPAYMLLQGNCKCAYCERKLESVNYGKGEQDVEHYRPKGNVRAWKLPKSLRDQGVSLTDPTTLSGGYYLLPYHPYNYAAACKPCNSALKKDYFPVAGEYGIAGDDPAALLAERPLLIYPLGDFDVDPEAVIEFYGITPRPVEESGHARHRALVTLEFFKLADPNSRKNLFRERALILVALFPQLEKMTGAATDAERQKARDAVEALTREQMPHANCARSFRRLFNADREAAQQLVDAAWTLINSMS